MRRWDRQRVRLLVAVLAAATLVAGCGDDGSSQADDCGFPEGVRCRPATERVDTDTPTFSKPTEVSNPLFPMRRVTHVLQRGQEEGKAARVEISLLPGTRTIRWNGRSVETIRSQFVAILDMRVVEVAVDYYAQDDAGNVWYFGEDVDNYERGAVADHEGSWLAGRDGPAAMIMPAHPRTGDVYRPENIPAKVFEEDRVVATGVTVTGPQGPVQGAIRVEEHLKDDTFEHKVFAPDYGEFEVRAEDEHVTVALALPTDARADPVPAQLAAIVRGTPDGVAAGFPELALPPLLAAAGSSDLDAARRALGTAGEAAAMIALAHDALDASLLYEPLGMVDRTRADLWARQAALDGAAGRFEGVRSDAAVLHAIATRSRPALGPKADAIDAAVSALQSAARRVDAAAVRRAVDGLRATLA